MKLTAKFLLEVVVLGGFILMLGTLAFIPVPESNKDLFGQGLVGLTAIAMLAAKSLWEKMTPKEGEQ